MRSDETDAGVPSIVTSLEIILVDLPPEIAVGAMMALFRHYKKRPTDDDLRIFLNHLADLAEEYRSLIDLTDEKLAARVTQVRGRNIIALSGYPGNGVIPEE